MSACSSGFLYRAQRVRSPIVAAHSDERELIRTVTERLQPTPYPLPIGVILRTEMLPHELFFKGDQPEINKPEKNDRRSNEPEGFYSQKAPDGNE